MAKTPLQMIPPILLLSTMVGRPGLSAMTVASKIISRQAEAGAPIGPAADGTQNIAEAMERIRVEEIINAIKLDARVDVAIPIGAIQIISTGSNGGGPIVTTGFNITPPPGYGVVR